MINKLFEILQGIPLHCMKPMQYMGKIKIRKNWCSQYRCVKCGKLRNIKD